jgi:hypothetical protein
MEKKEIKTLIEEFENGTTILIIANKLNRTYKSVENKLHNLNIKRIVNLEKISCKNCGDFFEAKTKENRKFCSRSCSTTYNNTKTPKRSVEGNCVKCDKPISKQLKHCNNCKRKSNDELEEMLLRDVIYNNHHKSSAFALVRSRARSKAKKLGMTKCPYCDYDKHVEIAHIKPISEFDLTTKLKIINNKNNIIPLCPNHHWEFDNKLIKLKIEN